MRDPRTNSGVVISGGSGNVFQGPITGTAYHPAPVGHPAQRAAGSQDPADVGIITVLPVETRAVTDMLQRHSGYRGTRMDDGTMVHEAWLPGARSPVRVAAIQTVEPGQRSAAVAYSRLRRLRAPRIVALVGISGAIGDKVAIGDVVIASSVIYYDSRRESAAGTHRRISTTAVPAVIGRTVEEYFRRHGEPARIDAANSPTASPFRVWRGPIGTGEAVVTDGGSSIRADLLAVNEKVLALETEAGGVAQAYHEESRTGADRGGWLVVRGCSDRADKDKDDRYKDLASRHAAAVCAQLVTM